MKYQTKMFHDKINKISQSSQTILSEVYILSAKSCIAKNECLSSAARID
jgi:hypothetical protein